MARSPERRGTTVGRLALALVALLLVLAAGAWLLRDLPRRWVERQLAAKLEAEVELGRFSVVRLGEFRLEEITIRQPGIWPEVAAARVPSLEVRGGLRAILAGRYRLLRLDGLAVELRPQLAAGAPRGNVPASVEAERLEVRRGSLTLPAAGGPLSCELEADLDDLGSDPSGTLQLRCGRLASPPILAFLRSRTNADEASAAAVEAEPIVEAGRLEAEITLDYGGRLTAGARLEGVSVSRGEVVAELGSFALQLDPEGAGARLAIDSLTPQPLAESLQATLWLDLEAGRWTRITAGVRRLRLAEALALAPARPAGLALDGVADLDLSGDPETAIEARGTASLSRLSWQGNALPVRGSTLRYQARLGLAGAEAEALFDLRLDLPAGAAKGASRPLPPGLLPLSAELAGTWEGGANRLSVSRLEGRTAELGTVTGSGAIEGLAAAPRLAADWRWSGAPLAGLAAAAGPAAAAWRERFELAGSVAGSGMLRGPPAAPDATATLRFTDLELAPQTEPALTAAAMSPPAWRLRTSPFESLWARSGADRLVTLSLPGVAATIEPADLPHLPVELSGRAALDPATGILTVAAAELATPQLGRGRLTGTLAGDAADLALGWTGADLPAWLNYLEPALGALPGDAQIRGAADLDLTLARSGGGPWRTRGALALAGGGFEAEAGSRVLDGLRLRAEFDGDLTPQRLGLEATLRGGGFQALWGTLYADYSQREVELALTLAAERSADGSGWPVRGTASSRLAGESTLEADFSFGAPRALEMELDARVGELGSFLDEYLVGPLQGSVAALDRIRASGSLEAGLRLSLEPDRRRFAGRLAAAGVAASTAGGGLALGGLDLDLPFDLAWSREPGAGEPTVGGPETRGRLSFAKLDAAGLTVPPAAVSLVVQGDSVALEESLEISLLGGRIELGRLTLAELLRPTRHAAAALRLDGIQLAELSRSQGWLPLEGDVSGQFPRLRVADGNLRVDGGGTISVFGGEVAVREISGAQIFSDYPRLTLSADFREIDLGRLTRKLDFGLMTGVIEGHVRELELFRGTPVRFRARLASRRRPGVPRTIGFRAIDNLAMLGGGGNIGVVNQVVGRFFDNYRYDRLGVAMVLDNDHFLLRGLARRGDAELFIRGRPPLRLDMVNMKPGRTVSFRTMLDRLGNLQVGGRPAAAGG